MRLFEGLSDTYVSDADGRPRRLYPLGAWWRSPGVRADVPRGVYAAICAEALRRSEVGESRRAAAASASPRPAAWNQWGGLILASVLILYLRWRTLTSWQFLVQLGLLILLFAVVWALFLAPARSPLSRVRGRLIAPVLGGSAEEIAGAMVANSRCASCAHQLDFSVEEAEGVVRCPECGAAWRAEALVGGDAGLR